MIEKDLERRRDMKIRTMRFTNTIVREKKFTFQEWLDKDVVGLDKFHINEEGDYMKNRDYVVFFCDKLTGLVIEDNYKIKDVKRFRNSVASFLYRVSSED